MMVVVYFLWFYFVCNYYVAPGENFKAKAWERVCRRQLLLDKLSTRIHKLFVFTPRDCTSRRDDHGGQITSGITSRVVCKWRKIS